MAYTEPRTIVFKKTKRGNYHDRRSGATLTKVPMHMVPKTSKKRNYGRMASYAAGAIGAARAYKKNRVFNTTLGQKLRRQKRQNNRLIRAGGCSILRMCMQNLNPYVATTDTGFNNAGSGFPLFWTGKSRPPTFDTAGTKVPTPAFITNLEWRHSGTVSFLPQCPSSKACFNLQGVGTSEQRFGVIPNYNNYTGNDCADNYSYNQFPMDTTYGFGHNAMLVPGTIQESGNTLKVFKSWVRIELENPNYETGMKVHIVTVKLRSVKYHNGVTCDSILSLNTCFEDLAGSETINPNLGYFAYLNECRGKLPSKIFRVIKHRVVTLGAKNANIHKATINAELPAAQVDHMDYTNNNTVASPRSCRNITMSFGQKTIRRTHCTNMSDKLFNFQQMEEDWNNQSIVMMYTEPIDAMAVLPNLNYKTPSDGVTKFGVNYRIFKTHKWKVVNNFSN